MDRAATDRRRGTADHGDRRAAAGRFRVGLLRAAAGAIIFAVPMLMTMEMWQLGFAMERERLALLLAAALPMLIALSYFSGFEETFDLIDDLVDAFVAYAVGFVASAAVLVLIAVIRPGMSAGEIVGKIAVQAMPAAIGAMLAQSQLGQHDPEDACKRPTSYAGELFLMGVGALFLSFNLAPTEEIVRIAAYLGEWHAVAIPVVSLALMHSFVYAAGFAGQEAFQPQGASSLSVFLRYTVVGYVVVLLICAYVAWSFGHLDGLSLQAAVDVVVVLGLPAAIGAAAARLIL